LKMAQSSQRTRTTKTTSTKRAPSSTQRRTSSSVPAKTAQAPKKTPSKKRQSKAQTKKLVARAVRGLILILIGLFLLLCVMIDSMGSVGAAVKSGLMSMVGSAVYTIPFFIIYFGVLLLLRETHHGVRVKTVAAIVIVVFLSAFIHGFTPYIELDGTMREINAMYMESGRLGLSGGLIGGAISGLLIPLIGKVGSSIVMVIVLIIMLLLLTNTTPVAIYKFIKHRGEKKAIRDREDREELKRREMVKKEREIDRERKQQRLMAKREQASARSNAKIDINLDETYKFTPISDEMMETAKKEREAGINAANRVTGLSTEVFDAKVAEFARKQAEAKKVEAIEQEMAAQAMQDEVAQAALASGAAAVGAAAIKTESAPVTPQQNHTSAFPQNPETEPAKPQPPKYVYPPITLLKRDVSQNNHDVSDELRSTAKKLVDTLASFNVSTQIVDVSRGPTVTRYELQPSAGVKVSKIVNLADDIALNLAAAGVRIEAPIPGKAAVGIEVPNRVISNVFLRDIITSQEFIHQKSRLTYSLGKDVSGKVMVGDIAKMPHMLIAGATGSGKSVCINSLIMSLLYKSTPEEVRLLLVDPKVVELGIYNSIPHLLIPVVTDPKKAAGALRWAVNEMLGRYKLFAESNVRDLAGYNEAIKAKNDPTLKTLPQIVIIIDELADLMMAAPNEVEDAICRLAQMARAAGMHLVIATQRPSVDVITGVIKANIPSRISFAVSSQVDSRTILDMGGAEKLLGKGDMLYAPIGSPKPVRIQGCFVSDKEIEAVVDFIKKSQEQAVEYDQKILDDIEKESIIGSKGGKGGGAQNGSGEDIDAPDEMLDAAIEIVVEAEMASVSLLQRKLKLGYARAARIVDQMEQRGIVGPYEGSKPRKVLISKQELMEKKMANHDW